MMAAPQAPETVEGAAPPEEIVIDVPQLEADAPVEAPETPADDPTAGGRKPKEAGPLSTWITLGVLTAFIVGVVYLSFFVAGDSDVQAGDPLQDFTVVTTEGDNFTLSEHQGSIVILDFMSSWCASCKITENYLEDIYNKTQNQDDDTYHDVIIISLDVDNTNVDDTDSLREYRADHEVPWAMAMANGKDGSSDDLMQLYGIRSLGYVIIVNETGVPVFDQYGVVTEESMLAAIDDIHSGDAEAVVVRAMPILLIAMIAGAVAFFSPCSFPLLPGYMGYYMSMANDEEKAAKMPSPHMTGIITASGIVFFFMITGVAVVAFNFFFDVNLGASFIYLGLVMGIILLGFGLLMMTPFTLDMSWVNNIVQKFSTSTEGESFRPRRNVFLYGVGFGAAATSCTAPIFLALVIGSILRGDPVESFLVFTVYSVTMGVLMIYFTLLIASAKGSMAQFFTNYSNLIKKLSGALLAVGGVYLILFFAVEQGWWPWWFPNVSFLTDF